MCQAPLSWDRFRLTGGPTGLLHHHLLIHQLAAAGRRRNRGGRGGTESGQSTNAELSYDTLCMPLKLASQSQGTPRVILWVALHPTYRVGAFPRRAQGPAIDWSVRVQVTLLHMEA
jgi:hypothetical protein